MLFYSGYATNDRMSVFKKEKSFKLSQNFFKTTFPSVHREVFAPRPGDNRPFKPSWRWKVPPAFPQWIFCCFLSVYWSHGRLIDDIIGLHLPGCFTAGAEWLKTFRRWESPPVCVCVLVCVWCHLVLISHQFKYNVASLNSQRGLDTQFKTSIRKWPVFVKVPHFHL